MDCSEDEHDENSEDESSVDEEFDNETQSKELKSSMKGKEDVFVAQPGQSGFLNAAMNSFKKKMILEDEID